MDVANLDILKYSLATSSEVTFFLLCMREFLGHLSLKAVELFRAKLFFVIGCGNTVH